MRERVAAGEQQVLGCVRIERLGPREAERDEPESGAAGDQYQRRKGPPPHALSLGSLPGSGNPSFEATRAARLGLALYEGGRGVKGRLGSWRSGRFVVSSGAHLSIASSVGGKGGWGLAPVAQFLVGRQAARGLVAPAGAKGWLRVSMCQIAWASCAGELDAGDFGAALFAQPLLRPLVAGACRAGGGRRGWSPRSAPSAGSGVLFGERAAPVAVAGLVDARAEAGVAGELGRARRSGRSRRSRPRSCRRAPRRSRARSVSSGT